MANAQYIPVWPGPVVMVPVPIDILRIGKPDVNSTTIWATNKNNYYNLWMKQIPDPTPFGQGTCPDVGVHLMWTLPYSMRQGQQSDDSADINVNFPFVPNRWLITRFRYPVQDKNNPNPTPPQLQATIVCSDMLFDIRDATNNGGTAGASQYPYPDDPAFPIKGIGQPMPLASWKGEARTGEALIKAVGPGDVSWSVAYDNVKNVFTLHDAAESTAAQYTYSLLGWYDEPGDDLMKDISTSTNEEWMDMLQSQFGWSVGGSAEVQEAVDDWLAWQKSHGLDGPFDPNKLQLPPQIKNAMIAWNNWRQQYGVKEDQPPLPTQCICHSMATVAWQGDTIAYGTGVPTPEGGVSISVGNNAMEAISAYMATMVVEGQQQNPANIPIVERALEAFQKDMLAQLNDDPTAVEMAIHADRFEQHTNGQEWIVVRPESTNEDILGTGGQQSIPLSAADTETLTQLNNKQQELNKLNLDLFTLRQEMFQLHVKQTLFVKSTPAATKTQVNNSMAAITQALQDQTTARDQKQAEISTDAAAFATKLGTDFVLKAVDLLPAAAPVDPVIMVGGAYMDTKLTSPEQYTDTTELFVRFTGQTVTGINITFTVNNNPTTQLIAAEDLLNKVTIPTWNIFPKEAMDLWVETMILDTSCAALIASIWFSKTGVSPTNSQMQQLTQQIQAQQTAVWNDSATLGFHPQALKAVSGIEGVIPSPFAVAFITQQPWTPIYMDWKIQYIPSSMDVINSLNNWKLGDIDFDWQGDSLTPPSNNIVLLGRAVMNAKSSQVVKNKMASFHQDPIYDDLPPYVLEDLQRVAGMVGHLDLLTQSMSGFTKQLITSLISINTAPTDANVVKLLGDSEINFRPKLVNYVDSQPFFPIRSGHFQLVNLWVVDAFGQVLTTKDRFAGPLDPLPNVYWSENLTTSSPNYKNPDTKYYGQLSPRVTQPASVHLNLLQQNNDTIRTNSSDLTSPICGWVMPNHIDNSLMVFDANGINQGAIIKVQRQIEDGNEEADFQYTVRWDAVPGSNTTLGAPPALENEHLQAFITNLLKTGFDGSVAYDDLMSVIDVTLWPMTNFQSQSGNLSVLLGRPLAVVRGEIHMELAGTAVYNQSWIDTGIYYDNNQNYKPTDPPYMGTPFSVRIGDSYLTGNGAIGYFEADNYDTFYAVYGANGQTNQLLKMFSRNARGKINLAEFAAQKSPEAGFASKYVQQGHTVTLTPERNAVKLTMLVDTSGGIPVIPGSQPTFSVSLPTGPVSNALSNLKSTFRTGPLLLDPDKIKMPTPAEVHGRWGWVARKDVTTWNPEEPIEPYTPIATSDQDNLRLTEGWITLSGANNQLPENN
ncbi:hypothetical protein CLV59_105470 [Chitinophaga dinghuensis]|uniref:Uncharacterized protein n=1 Tax=Chitinophaga dinghuensis TaxID=1539050 RepID=A0A327VWI1_9BACT|nr:hypothetical protein [Chitinophaga dinghuensis]RAJ80361.1 hypothetical protein CLV59_105470 [Chitinophaga dinghuensis]